MSASTVASVAPAIAEEAEAVRAIERARDHLLAMQNDDGYWKGALDTNVSMDAEDLLLRQFLGIRTEEQTAQSARWIRAEQRDDGTWANARGGPADLSTTVEADLALRLAGDSPEAPHMRRAAAWIRARGGTRATRVFTRIWLALFGLHGWDELPVLPPEMILLPPSIPLNVYDFACWARQTIVALTIVMTYRPVRPCGIDLAELEGEPVPARVRGRRTTLARVFDAADVVLRAYARHPITPLREAALAEAERWIERRQEADGSWGGIQPPWVYSIMALTLRGSPLDHPVIRAGIEGLEHFTLFEEGTRRLEACQSPVWDTALAMQALADAGVRRDHPSLVRAADWILDREVRVSGDWAVRRPGLRPSGWSFEFANVNYPDVDDTAEVMLALRAVRHPRPGHVETALARGLSWVLGMQSSDGGWAAFDADNTRTLCRHIPFCDFGEVIDDPSADVTAHVVEMLVREGLGRHPRAEAGVRWLLEHQEEDGSWFGRWGVNHVYGTGAVLVALAAAELPYDHRAIQRAVRWLEEHQNDDGGWGEDVRSYDDIAWRGRGASTPSQTAWALMGLMAVGAQAAIPAGIQFLVRMQKTAGGWDESGYTGTGFPGDFYIDYHLYRDVFPTIALGRYARMRGWHEEPDATTATVPDVPLARVVGAGGE